MTTYAVIPLREKAEDIRTALEGIQAVYDDYKPFVFFVKYGGACWFFAATRDEDRRRR